MFTIATVASNVPSNEDINDSGVAIISGAIVGTLLLTIFIIIMIAMIMLLCSRKKSKRTHNIDDKVNPSSSLPNPQQHTHNTSDQSQHDHTDSGTILQTEPKLETVNVSYISTKVKSLDSLLRRHDTPRTGVTGCDVIITPNPSYTVGPNSSEAGKECEYLYEYVQIDNESVKHDKVVGSTTLGDEEHCEVTDPADNVNIDPNPCYLVPQDVKLEDNPSYTQLPATVVATRNGKIAIAD